MARKASNFTILQFDERMITAMRVRRSASGVDVAGYWAQRGDWSSDPGVMGGAVQQFLKEHGLDDDPLYTVIPRHEMTTRVLSLPSQDPAEIQRMVELSAEEYVPYRADELVFDCAMLDKLPSGESRVLVVLAHNDVVEHHIEVLKNAEAVPERVFASTACLASAAMAAPQTMADDRYALANLSSGGLEVLVIHDGRLAFGRGVATVQDWSMEGEDAAHVGEELAIEARGSLSAYRRESEDGQGVDAVYLTSDWSKTGNACEHLEPELSYPVKPADFIRALAENGLERVENIPAVALGAALIAQDRGSVSIQLEPASLQDYRSKKALKRKALQYAAIAVALIAAVGILYGQQVHYRQAYADSLREEVEALQPVALSVIEKQRQLRLLQQQVDRSGTVLELLAQIVELAPSDDINITRFSFIHGQGIAIEGRARGMPDVDGFAASIRELGRDGAPQLSQARIVNTRDETERGQRVVAYQISVPFPEAESDVEELGEVSIGE